jgi:hypothetical protein
MKVLDTSGHPGAVTGRGAGGHCFPKRLGRAPGILCRGTVHMMKREQGCYSALEEKNNQLLRSTAKDLDLLKGIYG